MVKKNRFLSYIIIFSLILAACQSIDKRLTEKADTQEIPNSNNGVSVSMEREEYPKSITEVTIVIKNSTDQDLQYDNQPFIEKNIDGTWYRVPYKEDISTPAVQYEIDATKTRSDSISLEILSEKLSPGEYRIVNQFSYKDHNELLAAPFKLID